MAFASTSKASQRTPGDGTAFFYAYFISTGNTSPTSSFSQLSNCNPSLRLKPSVANEMGISFKAGISNSGLTALS